MFLPRLAWGAKCPLQEPPRGINSIGIGPVSRGRRHLLRNSDVTAIAVSVSGCLVHDIEPAAVTAATPAHVARMLLCTTAKTRLPDCRNCAEATLDEPAFTTATRRELEKATPTDRVTKRCPLPPNSSRIAQQLGKWINQESIT